MKKRSSTKPRNERVGFTTRDKVSSVKIGVDQSTGRIKVITPAINAYFETAYDRPKGDKILSRVPLPADELDFDAERALEKNFDGFFAVDTNTWDISGRQVSVTAVCECHKAFMCNQYGVAEAFFQLDMPICFAFCGSRDTPERAGWALTSDFVHASSKYDRYPRIGLVVDSDLGNLKNYNSRTHAFVADCYLPARVTLLYASADGGSEYFLNQTIRQADRVSRMCLEKIKAGAISLSEKGLPGFFQSLLHIIPTRPST